MAFSPNSFLSNINAKGGLAKPSRFQVVLPIPPYIARFIKNSLIEKILNLPNSIMTDVGDAINNALGSGGGSSNINANPTVSRYLSLQCESAELPGKNLITDDVKIYGPTFKVPYQTQYSDTTLTFICTNDFYERKLFERWMEAIMPTDTNNLRYPKGENSKYMTEITIKQYNDDITQIFAAKLIDAYPIGITSQALSWGDDNFHRLSIQFAYQRYEAITESSVNIGEAISNLALGGGAALFR
jgi:hypothetical protein